MLPIQIKKKNFVYKPWITLGLQKSIKKKNILYKNFLKSPSLTNEAKFKKYKNNLTSLLRTSKKMYFSNCLEISRHN